MKKVIILILSIAMIFYLVGCAGGNDEKTKPEETAAGSENTVPDETGTKGVSENLEGLLEEIIDKIYTAIDFDKEGTIVTEIAPEDSASYFGTEVEFEEAVASEYEFGGAYSLCLLRAKDGADIETMKKSIDENANLNKWVCMSAEAKAVESNGDVIMLIMATNDQVKDIAEAFKSLKN